MSKAILLIPLATALAICACCGVLTFIWFDDSEDPEYTLRTDGTKLVLYDRVWETNQTLRSRDKQRGLHSWKIDNLPAGIQMVSILQGENVIDSKKVFRIDSQIWSDRHEILFFVESSRPTANGDTYMQLWTWSQKSGFKAVEEPKNYMEDVVLSSDQSVATIIIRPYSSRPVALVVKVTDQSATSLPCPTGTVRLIYLAANRGLIVTHGSGKYADVSRWNMEPSSRPEKLQVGQQLFDDVTSFDGSIFALMRIGKGNRRMVRLDNSLRQIVDRYELDIE